MPSNVCAEWKLIRSPGPKIFAFTFCKVFHAVAMVVPLLASFPFDAFT
jgi:hypothetical protein